MTEEIQQYCELYQKDFKTNGMAIEWKAFDFCDKEFTLDAIKQPKVKDFFCAYWVMTKKSLLEQFNSFLKMFLKLHMIATT